MSDTLPSTLDLPRPLQAPGQLVLRATVDHDSLVPGTRLDEFEIVRVLGVGGFGIVYLAFDHALQRQVAIKEYMPSALAGRGDGAELLMRSTRVGRNLRARAANPSSTKPGCWPASTTRR